MTLWLGNTSHFSMPILISKTQVFAPEINSPLLEKVKNKNYFLEMWAGLYFFKIVYLSGDNKVVGYLVLPKLDEKLPCIIYNRGGSKEFDKIDDKVLFLRLAKYANAGYIVIASQYSGNDGSEGRDEFGGGDVKDILNLKIVLEEIGGDTNKISMIGGSRGGMMTYLVLSKVDWIAAAVIEAGTTNIFRSYEARPNLLEFRSDMYNVYSEEENKKRSALFWPEKLCKITPILIFHGTKDEQVNVLDSIQLAEKLAELKHPFELRILADDHMFSVNKKKVIAESLEWLDIHLKI